MEPNELRFVLERKARLQLRRLIADGNTPQKIVKRARIILMTADGHGVMAIMREVVLAFLKRIDRETPPSRSASDPRQLRHPQDTGRERWLARHKRFILHFTPMSRSWLNLVERLFAEITRQRIRRGIFHDVAELKDAIDEGIEHRNQDPKPFTRTATAKTTLAKHRRATKVLAKAKRK